MLFKDEQHFLLAFRKEMMNFRKSIDRLMIIS